MNVFQFMSDSPILTFFLALVVGETIVSVVKALRGIPETPVKDPDSEGG